MANCQPRQTANLFLNLSYATEIQQTNKKVLNIKNNKVFSKFVKKTVWFWSHPKRWKQFYIWLTRREPQQSLRKLFLMDS